MNRPLAIVDPYSGGALLAKEFLARGRECVMVQSTTEIPRQFRSSLRESDFREIIHHSEEDTAATVDRLRGLDVEFVLAGCDLGVEHAAHLTDALALVGNGTRLAAARRNKHLMAETVRKLGLATAAEIRTGSLEEALAWIRRRGSWPVVLKPLASTSSDCVNACRSEGDVIRAFESICGRRNVLGEINDHVLVQEFLNGTEYVVDTVSWEGRHRVVGIWRYLRSGASDPSFGYDAMQLEEGAGTLQDCLQAFAEQALDALEIAYGPAHCELMWTDDGPVLVEIGARPAAGINAWINRACSGICQLDLTVDAYTNSESFLASGIDSYDLQSHAVHAFLRPPVHGILKSVTRFAELEALDSFYDGSVGAKVGRPLPPVAGRVMLVHPDREVVLADLERLRELERSGLFEIEPQDDVRS